MSTFAIAQGSVEDEEDDELPDIELELGENKTASTNNNLLDIPGLTTTTAIGIGAVILVTTTILSTTE